MLDDLTADLIWPRLLKAGSLALRPSRLGLAFFYLIGLAAIVSLAGRLDGVEGGNVLLAAWTQWTGHLVGLFEACFRAQGGGVGEAVNGLFIETIHDLVSAHPLVAIIFLPLIVIWTALMGGAISRIAALDFAQGVGLSWPEGMGYALGRWSSFAGSILGPLALVYGIALALAVGGWLLFSVGGVNIVGGALWFVFLIASAIAAVIMLAMTLGGPMLVPAVACEGTDAIDAVQHAYSYVFARPLRLLVYMAILIAQFIALFVVVTAAIWLIVHLAQHGASVWVGADAARVIKGEPGLEGMDKLAAGAVRFWTGIPLLLATAFAVSYFWCAATVLYLAMRRICDGQDISEVWVDTLVPGTMAQRRSAASTAGGESEAIVDNGPADET
jgi:hypothetical protein